MKRFKLQAADEMIEGQEDLFFLDWVSSKFKRKLYVFLFFVYIFPQLTSILAFTLSLLKVHIGIIIPIMIIGPLSSLIVAIVVKSKLKKLESTCV